MAEPMEGTLQSITAFAKGISRRDLEAEFVRLTADAARREYDGIVQQQEAAAAAEREATQKAAAERAAAREEERERIRRASWLRHFNDLAITSNPDALWADVVNHANNNTPKTGFPASYPEASYYFGDEDQGPSPGSVAATHLGQLAKAKGHKI